jgi:hypothetical protein
MRLAGGSAVAAAVARLAAGSGRGPRRKLVILQNLCSNLVENLHDLLIDDLTRENCVSAVHVNDGSVAEGRQRPILTP